MELTLTLTGNLCPDVHPCDQMDQRVLLAIRAQLLAQRRADAPSAAADAPG